MSSAPQSQFCSLYTATNKLDGTMYVGWTARKPEKRWAEHLCDTRKTHFYNSIRKYGKDAFVWEVSQVFDTEREAKQAEIYWIAYLRDMGIRLYNETDGGEGLNGYWVGRKQRPEVIEKIRLRQTGKKHTEETKQKIKDGKLGEKNPNFGKVYSEEEKEIMANYCRGTKSPNAKLDWDKVYIARLLISRNISIKFIARQLDVSPSAINNAYKNRSWKIEFAPSFTNEHISILKKNANDIGDKFVKELYKNSHKCRTCDKPMVGQTAKYCSKQCWPHTIKIKWDELDLRSLLLEYTIPELAQQFNCSLHAVRYHCKKQGIDIRLRKCRKLKQSRRKSKNKIRK